MEIRAKLYLDPIDEKKDYWNRELFMAGLEEYLANWCIDLDEVYFVDTLK